MASKIEQYLNKILSSRFGKDVRQSIHDGIKQCYSDVTNPDLNVDAFETAVQNKIDSGALAAMTIADGSITKEKLDRDITENIETNTQDITNLKSAIGDLDRLETANNGDLVSAINEANQNSSGGLTDEIKQALLQIASKVAYVDEDGETYYDHLRYALYADESFEGSMYITVANETLKEGYIDDNGDFISDANNHLINRMVKALPFCVANAGTLVTTFPNGNISLRSAYYDSNWSFLSRDYARQPFKMVENPSAIYQKVGWYDPTETFNVSYIILLNEVDKKLFTNSNVSIDASGELSFESGFHATNLIRIPSGCDKYVLYSASILNVNKIAFYDSDKTFILREYTGLDNDNLSKYGDIPMNAVYYRMSKKTTDTMYNAVMKET